MDKNFIGDLQTFMQIFDIANLPATPELEYLRKQNFSVTYYSPTDKPNASKTFFVIARFKGRTESIFCNLEINTVLSILPCEVLTRFDKSLTSLPVVHIAITSRNKLFQR